MDIFNLKPKAVLVSLNGGCEPLVERELFDFDIDVVGTSYDVDLAISKITRFCPNVAVVYADFDDSLVFFLVKSVRYRLKEKSPVFFVITNVSSKDFLQNCVKSGVACVTEMKLQAKELAEQISYWTLRQHDFNIGLCAEKEMLSKVKDIVASLGIPASIKGRRYLIDCVLMYVKDSEASLTKQIYPSVAKMHGTTSANVERAIRNALDICFKKSKSLDSKPTNFEIIKQIANKIGL